MQALVDYIRNYAERGACTCGRCVESITVDQAGDITDVKLTDPVEAAKHQPTGHTADLGFFKVKANDGASAEELTRLIKANKTGEFCDLDVLDGLPHDYIELGGWIGSQELALMLIGLGTVLGLWDLMSLPGHPVMVPKRKAAHA